MLKCIRIMSPKPGIYLKLMVDKSLRYRYKVNADITCEFPTWAEVGEPYRHWFRTLIVDLRIVVSYGEARDSAPWTVDEYVSWSPPEGRLPEGWAVVEAQPDYPDSVTPANVETARRSLALLAGAKP